MIRYALRCARGHEFESWFQSSAAYDRLAETGKLACAVCGSPEVRKALMAPSVLPSRRGEAEGEGGAPRPGGPGPAPALSAAALAEAIAALRAHVEATSDYVGVNFVSEVRRMHEGLAPERSVWGEARLDEARALIEEGIPVAPLPFLPRSRTN